MPTRLSSSSIQLSGVRAFLQMYRAFFLKAAGDRGSVTLVVVMLMLYAAAMLLPACEDYIKRQAV